MFPLQKTSFIRNWNVPKSNGWIKFQHHLHRQQYFSSNCSLCNNPSILQKEDPPPIISDHPQFDTNHPTKANYHHHHLQHTSTLRHRIIHTISEFIGLQLVNKLAFRIEKTLAKKALSRKLISKSSILMMERVIEKTAVRVLQRIGRGAVLSVPLIGGILAVYSCRNDYLRARKEQQQHHHHSSEHDHLLHVHLSKKEHIQIRRKNKLEAYKYFFISSVFNGLDALLNGGMFYVAAFREDVTNELHPSQQQQLGIIEALQQLPNSMLHHTLENETILALLEVGSLASVVTATCMAILGEIASSQSRISNRLKDHHDHETNDLNNDSSSTIVIRNGNGTLITIAGNSTSSSYADNIPAVQARINLPTGIFVHPITQDVYFVDTFLNKVRKVSNETGLITTLAGTGAESSGGDDGPALNATIWRPWGLYLNHTTMEMFVTETYGEKIRKIFSNGTIIIIAGNGNVGQTGDGGLAIKAQLSNPTCVRQLPNGDVLFLDRYNNNLRRIDTNGIIWTVAGLFSYGYNGDNIPATKANLYNPFEFTVAENGDI
ncbi:hypothetical protein FDP41_012365 [Naegleria fowleri]|uniref:Uncharacterized protein n=1 Tax=Naegleria fowleri TaxID=5763 RepID=A0A6A5C7I4_NAEFO|nr:uncharacterized protein FDP41_012365 [Naegleria fowleri]KAF0981708.1 hypothetical protein FDP41_012365 [Naegleria fowleri]